MSATCSSSLSGTSCRSGAGLPVTDGSKSFQAVPAASPPTVSGFSSDGPRSRSSSLWNGSFQSCSRNSLEPSVTGDPFQPFQPPTRSRLEKKIFFPLLAGAWGLERLERLEHTRTSSVIGPVRSRLYLILRTVATPTSTYRTVRSQAVLGSLRQSGPDDRLQRGALAVLGRPRKRAQIRV